MKRLQYLQLGRGLAAFSVVVFHLTTLSRDYQGGLFYEPFEQVFRCGVDIFFVISGVVMVMTTYRKFDQPGIGRRFIIHRISRIYPPYLILTMMLTVLWFIKPNAINSKHGGVSLFCSYTLWPSTTLPLVPVAWSLSYEMMFYLVFFLLLIAVKRKWLVNSLLTWALVVISGTFILSLDSLKFVLDLFPKAGFLFSPYVLEFIAGCFIGVALHSGRRLAGGKILVPASVLAFALEGLAFQLGYFSRGEYGLGVKFVPLFVLPATAMVYGLLSVEQNSPNLKLPGWAILSGDMSYSLYLVHILIIHACYRYAWHVLTPFGMGGVFLVVTTVLAVFGSWLYYRGVERPMCSRVKAFLESRLVPQPKEQEIPA